MWCVFYLIKMEDGHFFLILVTTWSLVLEKRKMWATLRYLHGILIPQPIIGDGTGIRTYLVWLGFLTFMNKEQTKHFHLWLATCWLVTCNPTTS